MSTDILESVTFPSLRARMGDWWYYATVMSFSEVARWITRTDQIHHNARLRDWIQRELQGPRIDEISGYIRNQPQHFFNAIVVGIYGGDPEWYPVQVRDSVVVGDPQLDEAGRGAMGLLRLKGSEKIFAIDGQHRVEGIRAAVAADPQLGTERLCVVFVSHSTTESGRERTRRLFSTLNRNAKPVSKGEIVALDEDDAFAVVTRTLVEKFPLLKGHRVAFGKQTPIPRNNVQAITTILGLYDLVQELSPQGLMSGKELRAFVARRPSEQIIKNMYDLQVEFWRSLTKKIPDIATVLTADASDDACAPFRRPDGGHLLFRPIGQKAFGRATRVLVARGENLKTAVSRLASLPMELTQPPWVNIFWDKTSQVMITKNLRLGTNIMLFLAGASPEIAESDLLERYKKLTNQSLYRPQTSSTQPRKTSPAKKKSSRSSPKSG